MTRGINRARIKTPLKRDVFTFLSSIDIQYHLEFYKATLYNGCMKNNTWKMVGIVSLVFVMGVSVIYMGNKIKSNTYAQPPNPKKSKVKCEVDGPAMWLKKQKITNEENGKSECACFKPIDKSKRCVWQRVKNPCLKGSTEKNPKGKVKIDCVNAGAEEGCTNACTGKGSTNQSEDTSNQETETPTPEPTASQ